MTQLKVITLNVERSKHWDRILPFLEKEQPEVLCLQEVFDRDAQILVERFGYNMHHLPITKQPYVDETTADIMPIGPAIFSKLKFQDISEAYYYKASEEITTYQHENKRGSINQAVVWGTVQKDGVPFTIASTHFTWTPDGQPDANQDKDVESLLKILSNIPEFVICGDFNVPRGPDNKIYKKLTERFKDNVPATFTTTLDKDYHYAATNPEIWPRVSTYVVDYIFSTPGYVVSDVRQVFDLSDHCALVSYVSKN